MRPKKNYDETPYVQSTKFSTVKKKFTQRLVVMVETFRMSAWGTVEMVGRNGLY